MKVLRLGGEQIDMLINQPESGMGFQVVEVAKAYSREDEAWIVFNSELAIAFEDRSEIAGWVEMRSAGTIEWLVDQAVASSQVYGRPRVVMTRSGIGIHTRVYGTPATGLAATPLTLLKQSLTVANAQYSRFSPFRNDRRVDPRTGNYLPGTYATTITDAPMAPSGFAAVGRYALPNVAPSSYVHDLTSSYGTTVYSGTVAPAYGQSGGGVEVFFPAGATNARGLRAPKRLPDE